MLSIVASLVASALSVGAASTDFGIRVVGAKSSRSVAKISLPQGVTGAAPGPASSSSIKPAAAIGARWGRVTSTYRSAARNRAVGGARNSWHLSGRAIDIARRPGVRHADIAAAFRAAGYPLIESLDEGDHSHFAFGAIRPGGAPVSGSSSLAAAGSTRPVELTDWGIVTISDRRGHGRAGR